MSNVISTSTGTGLVPGRFDNTPLPILPRLLLLEIGQIPYSIERSGRENCAKKPGYYHTRYATNLHTCSLYYYGMYIYVRQVGIPVAKLQGCLFYSLLSADSRQRSRRTNSLVGEKYQV